MQAIPPSHKTLQDSPNAPAGFPTCSNESLKTTKSNRPASYGSRAASPTSNVMLPMPILPAKARAVSMRTASASMAVTCAAPFSAQYMAFPPSPHPTSSTRFPSRPS